MLTAALLLLAVALVPVSAQTVQSGLEALVEDSFAGLQGKRVAVVCNHTAIDSRGRHLVDLLARTPGVTLEAIFAPEHGYRGDVPDGGDPPTSRDPATRAPLYSLYGGRLEPTAEMLRGVDVILYDVQDVGARFYTYISTLGLVIKAAAANGIPIWVLDRPNPVGGAAVQGPVLDPRRRSFVGAYPIPVRYGLTAGELARMIAGERWLELPAGYAPQVVPLRGWRRNQWFDETGLPWTAPSPNMLSLSTATLYPGTCLLEGTNVCEGRGTAHPFEWIGAPWIDAGRLVDELRGRPVAGAAFAPVEFVPRRIPGRTAAVKYRDQPCRGVAIRVTDRRILDPVALAVHLMHAIRGLHADRFQWRVPAIDELYGSDSLRRDLDAGRTPGQIIAAWRSGLQQFEATRKGYLIYE